MTGWYREWHVKNKGYVVDFKGGQSFGEEQGRQGLSRHC
jgi:hypothetical protein